MKLSIQNTTRRGNNLFIKRTKIELATISYENSSTTILINNFNTQELHRTPSRDKEMLQRYIISEIRKDKKLYNKYRML